MLLSTPSVFAQSSDALVLKKKNLLQSKRDELQRSIHGIELRLHDIDRNRYDKLEEIEQLSAAYRDVSKRNLFSADIKAAIAGRSDDLHAVEKERSDCLEELDSLYSSLTRLNGDIAVCENELKVGGSKP